MRFSIARHVATVVLDNFSGVGSTVLAAERVGRVCYGIEIDPLYVDTAVKRWEKHTGQRAIHAATRQYFDRRGGPVADDLYDVRYRKPPKAFQSIAETTMIQAVPPDAEWFLKKAIEYC